MKSNGDKIYICTMVLQFSDSVYACFMYIPGLQTTLLPENDIESKYFQLNDKLMIKLKMIRGYNQNLYFAQAVNSNQIEIVNINLDPVAAVSK